MKCRGSIYGLHNKYTNFCVHICHTCLSWNLIAGYSKIFALCQSAFYGVGAYCTAILMTNAKWEFIPTLILGMVLASIIALLIALPSLRVHSDYFVVTSLASSMSFIILLTMSK